MPVEDGELSAKASMATLTQYLWSIIYMPHSMKILCLTNLFCWMSLVCYSLYFTDFVGEAVFKGNPVVRILHRLVFEFILTTIIIFYLLFCL